MFCKLFVFTALITGTIGSSADAAEVKFLCAVALKPAIDQLIDDFQKSSGDKVDVSYANIGTITDRIRKDEGADLAVTSPQQWAQLDKEGKIASDFRFQLAKVGIGIALKKGSEKPDLSSVAAVKASLLKARAVALVDPAGGGPSVDSAMRLFDRLGIGAEMKSRIKTVNEQLGMFNAVVNGEVDFGINQASLIAAASNVELATIPAELQNFTVFIGGVPKTAKQADAAKSFVQFITSPNAAAIYKSKGLEPG
jgi:molybdate transport system substrate-binding protein